MKACIYQPKCAAFSILVHFIRMYQCTLRREKWYFLVIVKEESSKSWSLDYVRGTVFWNLGDHWDTVILAEFILWRDTEKSLIVWSHMWSATEKGKASEQLFSVIWSVCARRSVMLAVAGITFTPKIVGVILMC